MSYLDLGNTLFKDFAIKVDNVYVGKFIDDIISLIGFSGLCTYEKIKLKYSLVPGSSNY